MNSNQKMTAADEGMNPSGHEMESTNGAVCAILVAAGRGARSGHSVNKVLAEVRGIPLLVRTMRTFLGMPEIRVLIVVTAPGESAQIRTLLAACFPESIIDAEESVVVPGDAYMAEPAAEPAAVPSAEAAGTCCIHICAGGGDRQASVRNGLLALQDIGMQDDAIVLVHDAARPFVGREAIRRCVNAVCEGGAACVGVPVKDTIKVVENGFITGTPDRSLLWQVQTPQGFRLGLLMEAHTEAERDGMRGTDDAMLVERLPHPVRMVPGEGGNIKITTPEDFRFAEILAELQDEEYGREG